MGPSNKGDVVSPLPGRTLFHKVAWNLCPKKKKMNAQFVDVTQDSQNKSIVADDIINATLQEPAEKTRK